MFPTILVFDFPEDSIQLPENAKYLQSDLTVVRQIKRCSIRQIISS